MIHDEKPSLEETLEHHGIKGMHWGVRIRGRSAYGEAKAAERQQARDKQFHRVVARKTNEIVSDPRSAITFGTTAAVGVAFMHSTPGKAVMKTSLKKAGTVAATNKDVQRTVFKILKGGIKLYIKAR